MKRTSNEENITTGNIDLMRIYKTEDVS